jgi:hypothetical protein
MKDSKRLKSERQTPHSNGISSVDVVIDQKFLMGIDLALKPKRKDRTFSLLIPLLLSILNPRST